jgi:aspartyl-tRNA(Asn)/glutamyl-tRNA(Gln) amidotransferase subunit C
LSIKEVRHVARLARLALTDEEVESLRSQLSDILAYAEKVGEVAASDVPPTGHAYPLRNVYRADEPRPSLTAEEAVSTAPDSRDGRFHVPRIVADDSQPDGGGLTKPDGGGLTKPDGGGLTKPDGGGLT